MEIHCMFQSILDCSDTQELVDAQLTLTRQEKIKQCYETLDPSIAFIIIKIAISRIHQTNNSIERYLKKKDQKDKKLHV